MTLLRITFAAILLLTAAAGSAAASENRGALCTSKGDYISDNKLDQFIDSFIPPQCKRLLVFTQCYGGDCAKRFSGKTNTAVASATSPGQQAEYGGYDDDSAAALKPGAGRTGQDVHNAGVAGKDSSETPSTGGGLALAGFSLAPPAAGTDVESRHIVVYAGIPSTNASLDIAQRDKIKNNFSGQPNTSVVTVGGKPGEAGWQHPGSAKGLRDAIRSAGQAITNSPNPAKEQFILYVTDHGDLQKVTSVTTPVPPAASTKLTNLVAAAAAALAGPFPHPGFSITVDLPVIAHPTLDPYTPFFPDGSWRLVLTPENEPPVELVAFEELYIEFDNDLIEESEADEGVRLFFELDPEVWVESFFDVTYDVEIFNDSGFEVFVREFAQDTGAVPKRMPSGTATFFQ